MKPPVFSWVASDPGVQQFFGVDPRIYPSGYAIGPSLPYCVWQVISGQPQNTLADAPGTDYFRVQFDVWDATSADAENAAQALRDALQGFGYQVSLNMDEYDETTKQYRISFDFTFWVDR